jgi:hypothetical protein
MLPNCELYSKAMAKKGLWIHMVLQVVKIKKRKEKEESFFWHAPLRD